MKESRLGRKIGKLTVIDKVDSKRFKCLCECGNYTVVRWEHLRRETIKSCGCLRGFVATAELRNHSAPGVHKHELYQTWRGMLRRCYDKNHVGYEKYGGRGVVVCDAWREDFWAFVRDVGVRPSVHHTLDRYPDKDGAYEPGNTRWATQSEQYLNSSFVVGVIVGGEVMTMPQAADYFGLSRSAIAVHRKKAATPAHALGRAILAKALHLKMLKGESVNYNVWLTDVNAERVMRKRGIENLRS